jgi:hypothetical protein
VRSGQAFLPLVSSEGLRPPDPPTGSLAGTFAPPRPPGSLAPPVRLILR